MFDIAKVLLGRHERPVLDAASVAGLADWSSLPAPDLHAAHFDQRYVLVDVACAGDGRVTHLAALAFTRGAIVRPLDSWMCSFETLGAEVPKAQAFLSFLRYCGKSPLVCYNAAYLQETLKPLLRETLGVDWEPCVVDLAWLLPALFPELSSKPLPLDHWLQLFGMMAGGRRDTPSNVLVLAKLFQRVIVAAQDKDLLNARQLLEETRASGYLRAGF